MKYEMKPAYYTGIETIDQEHARLFELAEETHALLDDNFSHDKLDQLTGLISELINYTRVHFSHEEAYMEHIHYNGIAAHMTQHRKFEDRLSEFDLDSIENDYEGQNETVEDLLGFLITWLIDHIQKSDMLFAKSTNR